MPIHTQIKYCVNNLPGMINGAVASLNNKTEEEARDRSRVWKDQGAERRQRQRSAEWSDVGQRHRWRGGENVLMLLMCGLI